MREIEDNKMIFKLCCLSEILIFIVAILIISVFAILLYIYFPTDQEVAQGIFTGFMAWIGAIVGFYFGQKPVRDVLTRLQERDKEIVKNLNVAKQTIDEAYNIYQISKKIEKIAEKENNKS